MATIRFEGPEDKVTDINARIATSKPFTTFLFHGLFFLDTPFVFKGGGRKYISTNAVLQKRSGMSLPVFAQVVDAHDPPQPWDWLKQLIPKPVRRFLHIWMASEVGATVKGFIILGDTQNIAFDVRHDAP